MPLLEKRKGGKKEGSQGEFLIWHALPQAQSCDELEHPTSTPTARPCPPVQLTLRMAEEAAVSPLDGIIYGSCLLKLQSSTTAIEGSRRLALLCFLSRSLSPLPFFFPSVHNVRHHEFIRGESVCSAAPLSVLQSLLTTVISQSQMRSVFCIPEWILIYVFCLFFAPLRMAEVQISWERAASLKSSRAEQTVSQLCIDSCCSGRCHSCREGNPHMRSPVLK